MSRLCLATSRISSLSFFDDRHTVQTVFIKGSGPLLVTLQPRLLELLQSLTTIAVNKVFFKLRRTYFLSAYVGEVMLAARRIPDFALLHIRPVFELALTRGAIPLKRERFEPGMVLPMEAGRSARSLRHSW